MLEFLTMETQAGSILEDSVLTNMAEKEQGRVSHNSSKPLEEDEQRKPEHRPISLQLPLL